MSKLDAINRWPINRVTLKASVTVEIKNLYDAVMTGVSDSAKKQ